MPALVYAHTRPKFKLILGFRSFLSPGKELLLAWRQVSQFREHISQTTVEPLCMIGMAKLQKFIIQVMKKFVYQCVEIGFRRQVLFSHRCFVVDGNGALRVVVGVLLIRQSSVLSAVLLRLIEELYTHLGNL